MKSLDLVDQLANSVDPNLAAFRDMVSKMAEIDFVSRLFLFLKD